MNTMLWGLFVMGVMFTVAYAAPPGKAKFQGNCETDACCPTGYECKAPGFGNASDMAQKKCYPIETTSPTSCPTDWISYENSCYFVDANIVFNYAGSTEYCGAFGAHVVAAETPEENEFLKDLLRNMAITGWIWLGLTDSGSGYTWDYTGLPPTYTDWGGPAFVNECASYYSGYNYSWYYDECFWTQPPICEIQDHQLVFERTY